MRTSIHPKYNSAATITCASCKTTYETGSTVDSMQIEVCSNCHPHYTGKTGNLVDAQNRVRDYVERAKAADSSTIIKKRKKLESRKGSKVQSVDTTNKLTLKDMLKQMT